MIRRLFFYGFLVSGLLLAPKLGFAHDFFGDTQPLLNGVVHPILTVPHLLLLIVFGLLGLTFYTQERLIGSFVLGLILGFPFTVVGAEMIVGVGLSLALLITGALVVWHTPVALKLVYSLSFASGFLVGIDTKLPDQSLLFNFVFYGGATFGVLAFFSYMVWLRLWVKQEWHFVVIRSLGAWMVAIAIMMLAFDLRSVLGLG